MAKRQASNAAENLYATEHQDSGASYAVPDGFEERSGDVAGFYSGLGSIEFVPLYATLADNKKFKNKLTTVVIGRLTKDCLLVDSKSQEQVQGAVGDTVGLFYRPGMSQLKLNAGIPVFMVQDGTKDTGEGNPMVVYKVFAPKGKRGRMLQVTEDRRKNGRHLESPLPIAPGASSGPVTQTGSVGEDDIPF